MIIHRARPAGFTLIELLVVFAVVGVLVALAGPSFSNLIDKRRTISAAEAIYAQLQYAKSEAQKQSRTLYLRGTTGSSWCVGIDQSDTCDCNVTDVNAANACYVLGDGSTKILKRLGASDYPGVSLTTANTITFEPVRGTVRSTTGSLPLALKVVSSKNRELELHATAMGSFRVCSPASASVPVEGYPKC